MMAIIRMVEAQFQMKLEDHEILRIIEAKVLCHLDYLEGAIEFTAKLQQQLLQVRAETLRKALKLPKAFEMDHEDVFKRAAEVKQQKVKRATNTTKPIPPKVKIPPQPKSRQDTEPTDKEKRLKAQYSEEQGQDRHLPSL